MSKEINHHNSWGINNGPTKIGSFILIGHSSHLILVCVCVCDKQIVNIDMVPILVLIFGLLIKILRKEIGRWLIKLNGT